MTTLLAFLALACAWALPARAQGGPVPRRPALPAGADTLDALVLHAYGISVLETKPKDAADAFYWASRLDPAWASPWYARYVALLMSEPRRLALYMDGNRNVRQSKEILRIDSMMVRAQMLNPFQAHDLDRQLLTAYLRNWYKEEMRRMGVVNPINEAEFTYWVGNTLRGRGAMAAWLLASNGRNDDALRAYAEELKTSKRKSGIHASRAALFFAAGRFDSAAVSMERAVEAQAAQDQRELVYLYESKGLYELAAGIAYNEAGDPEAARDAFGRALQEDLSLWPAHLQMGQALLAAGDTAGALNALSLAAEASAGEAHVLHAYASALTGAGKTDEAAAALGRAIAVNPDFAEPYLAVAELLAAKGTTAEAQQMYRTFLDRAPKQHPQRARVESLLAGTPTP